VRRRVLLPVPLAAVRRHFALPTSDIDVCSLLARRVVADPSQLLAQTLVLGHMLHGVVFAAVDRHPAPRTLCESAARSVALAWHAGRSHRLAFFCAFFASSILLAQSF
jgi:hypothetical protein